LRTERGRKERKREKKRKEEYGKMDEEIKEE
jgi:hypothetical protein